MRVGNKNTIDQIRKNRTEIEIKLTRYMPLYTKKSFNNKNMLSIPFSRLS